MTNKQDYGMVFFAGYKIACRDEEIARLRDELRRTREALADARREAAHARAALGKCKRRYPVGY